MHDDDSSIVIVERDDDLRGGMFTHACVVVCLFDHDDDDETDQVPPGFRALSLEWMGWLGWTDGHGWLCRSSEPELLCARYPELFKISLQGGAFRAVVGALLVPACLEATKCEILLLFSDGGKENMDGSRGGGRHGTEYCGVTRGRRGAEREE